MGRKKKEFKPNVQIEVPVEVAEPIAITDGQDTPKKSFSQEFLEQEAIKASLNIEKSTKDIMIKNIKELQEHEKQVREAIGAANRELEVNYRALASVLDEIKAQQYTLARQKETFEKENEKAVKELEKKTKEVVDAGKAYESLLSEVHDKRNLLNSELAKIADERKSHAKEMDRMTHHVKQVSDDILVREANMADVIAKYNDEKEAFECEKNSLTPELARISEIKGENQALWNKIESDKAEFDLKQKAFDSYKAQKDDEVKREYLKIREYEQSVRNKEASLRKMEEDLKDVDLQLKAREAEAQRMMKRYQLTKAAEGV
jgi:hypothetical protein